MDGMTDAVIMTFKQQSHRLSIISRYRFEIEFFSQFVDQGKQLLSSF